ncbi:hypothetical protein DL767_006340 [Monosporascus sp. MG133]|nr:hypothetical protein DL767_006340 [Monosporascus sp. MG133]
MVLTRTTNHTYSHPFPTVTLAFFLRYYSPQLNPFSSHVLSTDTLSSRVDPETGRLYTTRLHVKKSRMPNAVIKLLPTSVTGGAGEKSAYILETSVVDINEGWMKSESRNLTFASLLKVVEQHNYSVSPPDNKKSSDSATTGSLTSETPSSFPANTYVTTTFSYSSSLGSRGQDKAVLPPSAVEDEVRPERFGGWISSWGANRIQRTIESMASTKTDDSQNKAREGMRMVLERLRNNGVVAVLRELRRREGNVFEQASAA